MSEPASLRPLPAEKRVSLDLDPGAVERAYHRERNRRHHRSLRRDVARTSNARFYLVLALLLFITVLIALEALHQVQHTFGV